MGKEEEGCTAYKYEFSLDGHPKDTMTMGNLKLLIWVFITNIDLLPTIKNKIKVFALGIERVYARHEQMNNEEKILIIVA